MILKLIRKLLDTLPGCMYEITGNKYICPRYWILDRLKAERFWHKVGWLTCAKEIRRRLDEYEKRRHQWNDGKLFLFALCAVYCLERNDPLITRSWGKFKRALVFNPITDRFVEFLLDRLP